MALCRHHRRQHVEFRFCNLFPSKLSKIENAEHLDYPNTSHSQWHLLQNHDHVDNGFFSESIKDDGVENANSLNENTYSIIGQVDPADYRFDDGHFRLRLHYNYSDGTSDTLEWSQSSWITEDRIGDVNLSAISERTDLAEDQRFHGLKRSAVTTPAYLDGAGQDRHIWCIWHAVSATVGHDVDGGIPAHNGKVAVSQSLYVRSATTSNSTVPTTDPTTEPTSSPSTAPTTAPSAAPSTAPTTWSPTAPSTPPTTSTPTLTPRPSVDPYQPTVFPAPTKKPVMTPSTVMTPSPGGGGVGGGGGPPILVVPPLLPPPVP